MPGDNVEMVCSLVFDVALELGTRYIIVNFILKDEPLMQPFRFTLREANKTSESLYLNLYNSHIYHPQLALGS